MSWREVVRSKRSKLAAFVVIYLPFCSCSAANAVETPSLEDRSSLVQNAVQLHQQAAQDPATVVRAAVSALDPFTVVHATNLHKLPGAGGAAWGVDNTKSFGGVMVSDGPKLSTFGAMGGSDGMRGTSHGIYGGASSERPGRPLFAGAWHSNPGGVKVAHANPTADGGLDVSHTEHTFGSLPPGSSIEDVLAPLTGASPSSMAASLPPAAVAAAATSPTVQQAVAAAASLAAMAPDKRPQPEQISEILKQPFSADSITVAFRKPGAEKGPGWAKDDVLAAGGQFTSSSDLKGGFGGVGGYSTQDQKFHILYGGGLQSAKLGQVPVGAVGAIVGKPGEMDLTHLQPTADGGADVTNMHSNTRHVDGKELQKLLTSGTFSWPSAPQVGAPPAPGATVPQPPAGPAPPRPGGAAPAAPGAPGAPGAPATPGAPGAPAAPAAPAGPGAPAAPAAPGSAAPTGGEATTTAAAGPETTTAQPSFEPGSPEEAWGRITERMGDVMEDIEEGKLPPIVPESWATSTAAKIAMIIAKAFAPVKQAAEFLLKEVLRVKASMFSSLNMTSSRSQKAARGNRGADPVVPAFEVTFYRGVKAVLAKWEKLHESLLSAAADLTRGLMAANQTGLAKRFNRSLTSSDAALRDFAQHLENAVAEVPGSSELSAQQLGVVLNKTNAELYEALRSLAAFGPVAFARPVQDLVDKVSDMLSTVGLSPELVRRHFGAVEHVATAVQWRVRGAGRELLVGGHQAVVAVCERMNLSAPSWPPPGVEPVTEPLVEGESEATPWWATWFSSARGLHGPGVLLWVLLGLAVSAVA